MQYLIVYLDRFIRFILIEDDDCINRKLYMQFGYIKGQVQEIKKSLGVPIENKVDIFTDCSIYKTHFTQLLNEPNKITTLCSLRYEIHNLDFPSDREEDVLGICLYLTQEIAALWLYKHTLRLDNTYLKDKLNALFIKYKKTTKKFNRLEEPKETLILYLDDTGSLTKRLSIGGKTYKYVKENDKTAQFTLFIANNFNGKFTFKLTKNIEREELIDLVENVLFGHIYVEFEYDFLIYLMEIDLHVENSDYLIYNEKGEQLKKVYISNKKALERVVKELHSFFITDDIKDRMIKEAAKRVLLHKHLELEHIIIDEETLNIINFKFREG